jgi:hypothetical protein
MRLDRGLPGGLAAVLIVLLVLATWCDPASRCYRGDRPAAPIMEGPSGG